MVINKIPSPLLKIYSKGLSVFMLVLFFGSLLYAGQAEDFYKEAVSYFESKNYQKAALFFEAALKEDPGNAAIEKNLSLSYCMLAQLDAKEKVWHEAIEYYKRALGYNPQDSKIRKNLAVCLANKAQDNFQKGRTNTAIFDLKEALKYDPSNATFYALLADCYYRTEDFANAEKFLKKGLEVKPQSQLLKAKLEKIKKDEAIEKNYRKKRLGRFLVKYEGTEQKDFGKKTLSALRQVHSKINWTLNYHPKEPITTILYTEEKYRNAAGYPDWSGGAYDGKIRVRLSDYLKGEDQLKKILAHEYTHAVIYRVTSGNCPYWLNEGLAQLQEPQGGINRNELKLLKELNKSDKLIPLSSLNKRHVTASTSSGIALLYIQSKSLTEYVLERFFLRRVRSVLQRLGEGIKPEEAIQEEFDISTDELEKKWKQWLKRQ